jgi:hypothetical protein
LYMGCAYFVSFVRVKKCITFITTCVCKIISLKSPNCVQ